MVDEGITKPAAFHRELRVRTEAIRRGELERALRKLGSLAPGDREAVEALTRQLVARVLGGPAARLEEAAANGGNGAVFRAARELLGLERDQRSGRAGPRPRVGGSSAASESSS